MKTLIAILFTLTLAACGGGTEPESAQPQAAPLCNGTPTAAVVYAGTADFPELAVLPNACVYSTATSDPVELNAVIDRARIAAGTPRAYLIASHEGATTALRAMNARPGYVEMSSLWYPGTADVSRIKGSLATIYLNALGTGTCEPLAATLRAQGTPALCKASIESRFGDAQRRAALMQLGLFP